MQKQLTKLGFLCALGEAAYIGLVALLMSGAERFFGNTPDNKILAPITFLLLFVLSAAVSGALVLGKPALMYMEGKKKEALALFGFTLLWLFVFFVLMVLSLIIFR
ncbi:MAG: hypothetical protein A2359_00855 [Candidatus Moranbacteria bacterium RIFOXYB1_FULL_43_19]|nr:MAG: hypothetical protein A2359_00855 [Candidatus Moranbacteria bacterium RIFOXYB1_FULL_43_19]OGI33844.1 MAG: hypothetical protein A2420_05495 [Candidatus Moranbacteria bacterium RIFOXYC1_FULL_44_13]OGI38791.1 MAG: hypothetical protein A2612_01155 [Candidatus Moranbacteria bacterium RIFOXYD1_FULL_44_12]